MSLLDKASLIVTPNAYKESKLYSVFPSSGAGDMDVVRATTATRVNSAGLIEVVSRNLITYSEQIDNADWVKTNLTITANATNAPNGTLTAEKLIPTVTNDLHITESSVVPFVSGNSYTFSFYAKRAENNFIQITASSSLLSTRANFNLLNGTLGTVDSGITATITLIDNDWYRCTASFVASATGNFRMILSNITASTSARFATFAGNGTSGVFVWGFQVDNGSTATEYFPTTTRLNVPRIDYTNGSCPSLLVEPQRTNLFLRSEEFNNATWTPLLATVTANNTTAPSGNLTADKFVATATTGVHILLQTPTGSVSGTTYTASVFVKAAGLSRITLLNNQGGGGIVDYNLTTNTFTLVSGVSASIQNYGNGWYRCVMTFTANSTGTFNLQVRLADSSGNTTFTGNGVDGVSLWGFQVEQGTFATSYIPTVASTVTRNADVISKTGISSLIGQTEGTMFCDVNLNSRVSFTYFTIADNLASATNYLGIAFLNNSIAFESVVSGALQANISHSNTSTGRFKIAAAYKANDFVLYINGTQIGVDTSGTIPTCSEIGLSVFNQAQALNYNSAQLYKTRLSNSELAQLTTL